MKASNSTKRILYNKMVHINTLHARYWHTQCNSQNVQTEAGDNFTFNFWMTNKNLLTSTTDMLNNMLIGITYCLGGGGGWLHDRSFQTSLKQMQKTTWGCRHCIRMRQQFPSAHAPESFCVQETCVAMHATFFFRFKAKCYFLLQVQSL
jgi:hypothetical protein